MNTPIYILFLVGLCTTAKLPENFRKCHKNQDLNKCLPKAVQETLKILNKPNNEVGLPSLHPLEIPSLTIGAGTGPVELEQQFKNVKIYGFTNIEISKFDMDFDKKTSDIECVFPEISLESEYAFNGKILLLPIYGKGPSTITLKNVKVSVIFNYEEYEKKGKKHYKVIGTKVTMAPSLVTVQFDNLFDGDKALGDNINKVFNDNWRDVFADLKNNWEEAIGQIVQGLYNNLLAKVPLSEIFIE